MELPKTIRIGCTDYTLFTDDHDEAPWGKIGHNDSTIKLSAKMGEQATFSTLWHEVVHGIMVNFEGDHGTHDEAFTSRLANAIVCVLRDNKYLRGNDGQR